MNICVFASSCDVGEAYAKAVYNLGCRLGSEGHTLVYGGYGGGLMGAIADGFHDAGAEIIGVVPGFLEEKTDNYPHLTKIIRTSDRLDRDILIYNVNGFFDGLLDCLKAMEDGGFLYSRLSELYRVENVQSEE